MELKKENPDYSKIIEIKNNMIFSVKNVKQLTQEDIPEIERLFDLEFSKMYDNK